MLLLLLCSKVTYIAKKILPVDRLTKKFILNPVEGSSSAPTRFPNQHLSVMG